MDTLSVRAARRLALARGGLLKPEWTGMPVRAAGRGARARTAAQRVIERFGYLQLDTVSVAGARSHAIVLMSRIDGMDPALGEELLRPGEPLFEYWGHEASWLPMDLYPIFDFRRREFRHHPWWGDIVGRNPGVADRLVKRIRDEGPLRSVDMEGSGSQGWWDLKVAKKVATALWSSGELAIRERRSFQRSYDLADRVIPERWRSDPVPESEAIKNLLILALEGHGWATTGTLTQTWRLARRQGQIKNALATLEASGRIRKCKVVPEDGGNISAGFAARIWNWQIVWNASVPGAIGGSCCHPSIPLLWDRQRVEALFGFHQVLEIFKPAEQRIYGYYCLPVLAGDQFVARFDLKADRAAGRLHVLSLHIEEPDTPTTREAARTALARHADALALKPVGWS